MYTITRMLGQLGQVPVILVFYVRFLQKFSSCSFKSEASLAIENLTQLDELKNPKFWVTAHLQLSQQLRIQRGAKGAFAPSLEPKMYIFFNKIKYNFKKFNKNSQIFTEIAPPREKFWTRRCIIDVIEVLFEFLQLMVVKLYKSQPCFKQTIFLQLKQHWSGIIFNIFERVGGILSKKKLVYMVIHKHQIL